MNTFSLTSWLFKKQMYYSQYLHSYVPVIRFGWQRSSRHQCNEYRYFCLVDCKKLLNRCFVVSFLMDQEMDCIVNQMMAVAEYLGWDASELKPVIIVKYSRMQFVCSPTSE